MLCNFLFTLSAIASLQLTAAQGTGCASQTQPTVSAPYNNPWNILSEDESSSVYEILQRTLNLTENEGSSRDSYVEQITLLHPNKTDVVAFFDGVAKPPARYARATVAFGATNLTDSFWQEYMIGPLPTTNSSRLQPLTYPFHNQQPGKTKVHPVYSRVDGASFLTKVSTEIEDITRELWNSTIVEGGVGVRIGVPFWDEDGRIISWATFFTNPDPALTSSPTLLAGGVSVRLDLTSRNWNDWKATSWYSRGVNYESTEDFRSAVFSLGFDKPAPNVNGNWTSTDQQGSPLPLDDLPPPISISQGSQRFKIDIKENYVSWMDFSFYFSVSYDIGLSLFDIEYKGKRLIYELSLQEALTLYAGSEPFASQATFFDSVTGMGATLVSLVRGFDCPSHATYLNATFSEGNTTRTQADAICIFEYDTGYPIRRHSFSPAAPHTSVAKNIVFTVRTIATVGNYDFMIEYHFYYDGSIEVSARASGYISAAYWEGNSDYGFHIHDHLSGSLHDHVLTFKADIDILGAKNSVQKVELVPAAVTYPWSEGIVHNTFKALRSFVSTEASIKWPENDAAMYAVVNKDTPNRFGEYPGYRIKRSAGTTHLTTSTSSDIRKAGAFATHDFYITKQKDSEPRAADAYNQYAPDDPLVDFSKFLDGEAIEQEDLVLWFNLGMHHMPHTGDLPNTMFTAAHSAMRFEPLNYLEGDPSVASNQQVRLDYTEDGSVAFVEEFGKVKGMCE